MSEQKFQLPRTVGPWFTFWIEYIPVAKLGREKKLWFREAVRSILEKNPFGRKLLSEITAHDLNLFFEEYVNKKFSRREADELRAYFNSAMVAAHNQGGAPEYRIKHFLTKGQLLRKRVGYSVLAVVVIFGVLLGSLTVDRMVRKQEDFMTASATVLRENGFGVAVAAAEDFYYTYIKPAKVGGTPTVGPNADDETNSAKVNPVEQAQIANNPDWGVAGSPSVLPESVVSPATSILAGEGEWKPTKILVNGNTAIWVARIRPDAIHTSYWATITWFDPKLLAFQQIPGTKIPEVSGLGSRTGQVPSDLKPFYVAGLNDGFLMRDSQGGYAYEGKVYKTLRDGKASLITYSDGTLDVVQWGRDPIEPNYQAIRQNMSLIVDGGVNQVKREDQSKWGWVWHGVGSGKNLVARSAIGVRADGTVVSVLGSALSASALGDILVRAGVQRAILLDMNSAYANGFLYGPYGAGKKLDPGSTISSRRFLNPSERDFVAIYMKSPADRID